MNTPQRQSWFPQQNEPKHMENSGKIRRKSFIQSAGHRISSIFVKPTSEPRTVETAATPALVFKKFRQPKKFPTNTKLSHMEVVANSAIINGSRSDRPSSKKPHGISIKEWLAVNAYIMYNSAARYYGWLSEKCTAESCPKMTAGTRYEFKWTDGKISKDPESTPAITYTGNLLDWVNYQFKDELLFPNYDGAYYSRSRFIPAIQDISRRLLRVYAHILVHHLEDLQLGGLDEEFVKYLRHFMDFFERYGVLPEKDIRPIIRSVEWLTIQSQFDPLITV